MLQLFKHTGFRPLWLTHLLATLANELTTVSVIVLVFGQTGSALQATGVLVARNLPPLLFGPFAGSIIDRLPKRSVLVGVNLFRALWIGLFLLASLWLAGNIWLGYVLVFGLTIAEILHKPTVLATLPAVAPADQVVRANSLIFTTSQVVFTIGYLIGGLVAGGSGPMLLSSANLGIFLLAGLSAAFIGKTTGHAVSVAQVHFWRNVVEGFAYLRNHKMARTLITVEFLESWPHGAWTAALMLTFTIEALGAGTDAWGYQSSAFFAGQLLGALVALSFASRLSKYPGWVIIANAFLMSALTFLYAVSTTVWAAVLLSMAFGPPFALRDVAQDSLIQTTVAPEMLGRIYALREMFSRSAFLVGGLLFARLADTVGIREIYLLTGVLYFATALYTLFSRGLRTSRIEAQAT